MPRRRLIDTGKNPVPAEVLAAAWGDWWDDFIHMWLVGLAALACWVTVLLGPPATFGAYYVANRLAHGDSLGLRGLLTGMRRYFVKSWLWMLANLVVAAIVAANFLFYSNRHALWAYILQVIFVAAGLLWLAVQFYAIPYLMEQERKSLRIALRNGLYTLLAAPGYGLAIIGASAVLAVLCAALVIPLFLGLPLLVACIGSRAVLERLATYGVREREAQAAARPSQTEETSIYEA